MIALTLAGIAAITNGTVHDAPEASATLARVPASVRADAPLPACPLLSMPTGLRPAPLPCAPAPALRALPH